MKSVQKTFLRREWGSNPCPDLREPSSCEWKKLHTKPTELNGSFFQTIIKKTNTDNLVLIYDIIISLKFF